MRRFFPAFATLFLLTLPACSNIWAQAFSGQMADSLLSLQSYRGRLVQHGLLPDAPATPVVEDVLYARAWRVRAEVTAPDSLKGTLFIYDGQQLLMWWPQELFGIRVRGLENPDRDAVVAHIGHEMKDAMDHYAFSLTEGQRVADHAVSRWRIVPLKDEAFRMQHTSWVYDPYAMPLKMEFTDHGGPWYSFEFTKIDFGVPVPGDAFSFSFPENALVFDWDMRAPGIPLAEAQRTMNFTVMQPARLPAGHVLRKIVRSTSCLPMLALQYDHGASVLSLTESRAFAKDQLPRFGKPVQIGTGTGWLYFVGNYTVLSWIRERTLLTLISNLSFPQVIAVARSVE